jgi:hypothetical protein
MATKFVEDLLLDPAARGVHDIKHELTAVVSSTSRERAEQFAAGFAEQSTGSASAYSNLEDMVADKNVDVVYIASPTSKHYEHASICLRARKAVLCEVRDIEKRHHFFINHWLQKAREQRPSPILNFP